MPTTALETGYAPVNGLNLYYEIHGEGEPLVLLHGGLGSTEMFGEILPLLANKRRVIVVDLQAHGRTADIDRPLSYEAMAGDIAALMKHLGIGKAALMGYSLGAGVALRAAIQHPELVAKLVVVSTVFKRASMSATRIFIASMSPRNSSSSARTASRSAVDTSGAVCGLASFLVTYSTARSTMTTAS